MSKRFGLLVASTLLFIDSMLPVSAQTIGPAKPDDLRVLGSSIATSACPGQAFEVSTQVLADGSLVPFRIPSGSVFVITGGFFDIFNAEPGSCRMSVSVSGSLGVPLEIGAAHFDIGSDNSGVGTFQVPIGFPVRPGTAICVQRCPLGGEFISQVYGYFTKE